MIPLAMLFAVSMMNIFGVSGNLMSLGALDFGLIVDGAVIIVESTLHFLYHSGNRTLNQHEMDIQVNRSASKFSKSAVFGQIIILVVYLPLLALVGIEGKMFKPMAQTVMFAIIGALILSLTYVPMISAVFLNKKIVIKETWSDKIIRVVRSVYIPLLQLFIRKQRIVLSALFVLLLSSVFLFSRLGAEFIPSLDEGDFAVETRLITGTSLTKTIEETLKASELLKRKFPEVLKVVGKIGTAEIPTDPMPMEACDLMVILKDRDQWVSATTKDELAENMQQYLEANLPGVSFGFQQPIQMRFNELMTGAKQDVVVKVYGEDLDKLSAYAEQIGKLSTRIEGVQDVYVEQVTGLPQLVVTYDRQALSRYNISVEDVNRAINISFAGQSAGLIFEGEKRFDLVVKLDSVSRASLNDLRMVTVASPLGVQVPIEQVAKVDLQNGPNQIQRDEAKRRIIVGFNVRGRDVQSIVNELKEKIKENVAFETGYFPTYGGTFKNLENARKRLAIAVPASLFLIFFLLYLTFQSIKQAVLIFSAIPLAALGGILALSLRGMPFSISAGVGFIALFGVAVLNGIVLISEFNSLKKEGYTNRLRIVLLGTKVRMRPVLLTALVASLGFLPMALSHGSGAEVQKPLATVVIGGLITATILTLFVLPIFYLISERKMKRRRKQNTSLMIMVLFTIGAGNVFCQETQILSLEKCLEISKSEHPLMRSAEMQISKGIVLGKSRAEIPKTGLDLMVGQYNSYFKGDNNLTLSQTIPFPSVLLKEKQLGVIRSEISSEEKKVLWKDISLEIHTVYDEINFRKARELILKQQDSVLQVQLAKIRLKYELKDATKLEESVLSSKSRLIGNTIHANALELKNAERRLQLLLGMSSPLTTEFSNYQVKANLHNMDSATLSQHPSIKLFELKDDEFQKERELNTARLLPDISLKYVNQTLVGVHTLTPGNDIAYVKTDRFQAAQIGLELPLFFGASKHRTEAIDLSRLQNQLELEYSKRQMESSLFELYNTMDALLNSMEVYQTHLLPESKIMEEQAIVSLETGQISMMEFLQTKQMVLDIELTYIDVIHECNKTYYQIDWYSQNQ
ncbi:MAG: CusA/CzcA family heavy metal efflux RND transporter [Cryomorphaceae bacterium]|nr:CusA/CzcA family heavy metal efflux RND transporter [Cryomorphaceae bacterium]